MIKKNFWRFQKSKETFAVWKSSFTPIKFLQELILSRDTLEIGAQYSVAKRDIPAFERYIAQLQTYYYDHAGNSLLW
jgi:hypothetical protein